ncbi:MULTISPECIES: DNA repair protein RecN [Planktothricoides]|uniref:DNA repair protein RecN n=2 Tax=Planktothricoides raciborskii TaxID=132608 RepID=A0AAU8JHK3_9CYAN|nr:MULTISPECIES: DNA repair protein RecN [Planktothricoides]KOR35212.1 DNA recombination protein RecN [Planktothricoides sp. SR001]MBD2544822.1 DNA repair protein RecN [Planktothricoides raciborskii FACHB-1370]MBD2582771.1 DNA repair protein RecN [Planktothricoides raciborskii FACHB-1261]
MLLSLRIENFALVDHLELEFGQGLNVLTGETGAGKSIILDAVDVALAGKVNGRMIRTGTERSLVEATFAVTPLVAEWLREQEIDPLDGKWLVASRDLSMNRTGAMRSRSRLNGILVNRKMMDSLRDRLVEITAQGQTTQLGQPAKQRDWLDAFGGADLIQQRQAVAQAFTHYSKCQETLENRRKSEQQRLQRLDVLQYQVKELGEAALTDPEELSQLEQERQRLSHVVELQQQSYQVYQALYQNDLGSEAAADLLGQVESTIADMVQYDPELQSVLDLVKEALTDVVEAGRQMSRYSASLEADPDRLEEVEQRINELKKICRKYGPSLPEAIAYYHRIQGELAEITSGEDSLEKLEQAAAQAEMELKNRCNQLTDLRRVGARNLSDRLLEELRPLAMDKVRFEVEITPIAPTSTGADRITFLFSPNPGEPLQPLSETASGGEMSRFLLALKACFIDVEVSSTLVFDEIDVGVSGRVAQAIAEKLHQLSYRQQILFVTHQPIVAAMADHHFHVHKKIITADSVDYSADNPENDPGQRTVVRVQPLANHQRREELAQLAGGKSAGEAIAFAESLLGQAAQIRLSLRS